MSYQSGMPKAAVISISDMLDNCAGIEPGQEVLLLAQIDGLYSGDNMVDEQAISWIQSAVQSRGANASVLWIDEPDVPHAWRFPPVVKAAMAGCDVLINHSFNLVMEEIAEFRNYTEQEIKVKMVRNMATTSALLCTEWAQTPHELVSEIRHQSSKPFTGGSRWKMVDDNGTYLEGVIVDPLNKPGIPGMPYSSRRDEAGYYRPWPEWVHPPINVSETSGELVFDCMLSWWSRYIGVSPYFDEPVRMSIKDCRITDIRGGREAEALRSFLEYMKPKVGDGVYNFDTFHFGVHPQASVWEHQCPNILHRRLVEHAHSSNIHVHIGSAPSNQNYPYWMHITGDIRNATLQVGDTLVYDKGYLAALDDPAVVGVADKYPGRPGLPGKLQG
ncbi:MAG: hypothetical protein K9J79_08130 [Desulfobacteraceae bacterium]|nr:hypothetical protein [Desulfobacteraceae bacterium]